MRGTCLNRDLRYGGVKEINRMDKEMSASQVFVLFALWTQVALMVLICAIR